MTDRSYRGTGEAIARFDLGEYTLVIEDDGDIDAFTDIRLYDGGGTVAAGSRALRTAREQVGDDALAAALGGRADDALAAALGGQADCTEAVAQHVERLVVEGFIAPEHVDDLQQAVGDDVAAAVRERL